MNQIETLYRYFLEAGSVTTDTRKLTPGSIFFALKGASFNGNEFAAKALESGCSLAVVDENVGEDPRLFSVLDVLKALQELASLHRNLMPATVIGLTGSNGKTTTKELLHAALSSRYKVLATEGNLNNHIGVPLTLLRLTKQHQFAVIEMGANHQGEIRDLCSIAQPDAGLITNIGKAHLEGFGGIEGVKKGKGELYDHLRNKQGLVFTYSGSNTLMEMSQDMKRITYGESASDFVTGEVKESDPFLQLEWTYRKAKYSLCSNLTGKYNLSNLLAALAVALHAGAAPEEINRALEAYQPRNQRSQWITAGSVSVILDAYNANPSSMEAAIKNLAAVTGKKKIALLGDMLELGEDTEHEHRQIVNHLKSQGIDHAMLVGPVFHSLDQDDFPAFANINECREALRSLRLEDSVILVKGSRGMRMEELMDSLTGVKK